MQAHEELGWAFLQDAAVLRPAFPDIPCYKDLPVFEHELWEPFSQEVQYQHFHGQDIPTEVLAA